MKPKTRFPFEANPREIERSPDPFVDTVFACLESEFLVMPRGNGFVSYALFEHGYEALKAATAGFNAITTEKVLAAVIRTPVSLVVLRTMLGFTPPEWAYLASQHGGIDVSQGYARTLDRNIRLAPDKALAPSGQSMARLRALVDTACHWLEAGRPDAKADQLHRLDKADTAHGLDSLRHLATMGVPYAMLLYERFLGRPFAGHRDSVSELIGDGLESAIEQVLSEAGISARKTRRAEKLPGFDQTPDFVIPSEFNPQVVIEAKITEDDGTARDKVTRIQHLAELGKGKGTLPPFQVIACIGGRGFGVRREDMRKMLLATEGKVFTPKTLDRLVAHTRLAEFATKPIP